MAFTQLPLPFATDALESYGMKAETFEYHYGKHHAAYVTNLNNLTKDTELANKSLEEVIQIAFKDSAKAGIFNNAAQVWNHSFFWNCLKPAGGGAPTAVQGFRTLRARCGSQTGRGGEGGRRGA